MGRICRGGNGRSSLRPRFLHKPSLPPVIEQSFIVVRIQVGLVTLISAPSSPLKPFSLSRVLHAPPTSISLFKRFPRLEQGSKCTSPAFRSPHHGVTLSMRRWVHMSPLCIQMFNVANANVSAEDVTCCLEHKLHLDVRGVQGQGGHMWLVHLTEREEHG